MVDAVARASKDPSYRKPKFRRYLEEYSRDGLCCRRGKRLTPERKTYYESIRRRKTEAFIRQNRVQLEKRNKERLDGGILLQEMKAVIKKKL
ncbi:UNVERIFIED_CONTAM: hypothetical protein NY100_10545 [Prevotella sp. 15_C9]